MWPAQLVTALGHNHTHQEQGEGNIRLTSTLSHTTFHNRVMFFVTNGILINCGCTLQCVFYVLVVTVVFQRSTSCVLKKQQLCSEDVNFDAGMHDTRKKEVFFQRIMSVSISIGLIL